MKKPFIWATLASSLACNVLAVSADNLTELQTKRAHNEQHIDSLEQKKHKVHEHMSTVRADLTAITAKINTLTASISRTEAQIQRLEAELAALEADIQRLEADLAVKRAIIAENARLLYTNGKVSYLEYLFSYENVFDLLDRAENLKTVATENKRLYDEVQAQADLLKQKKAEVTAKQAAVQQEQRRLLSLKKEMDDAKTTQTRLLQALEAEEKELNAEIQAQEAALSHIESQIGAIIQQREAERKRREAEAAAAKAAAAKAAKASSAAPAPPAPSSSFSEPVQSGPFARPMKSGTYRVSSSYGWRIHPVYGTRKLHGGIDLAASVSTPIYAAGSGTVLYAGPARGFGNWIVIDHNNGYFTVYGHMYANQLYVRPGQQVSRGAHIAGVGAAGIGSGAHLHFEVHQHRLGQTRNPASLLSF